MALRQRLDETGGQAFAEEDLDRQQRAGQTATPTAPAPEATPDTPGPEATPAEDQTGEAQGTTDRWYQRRNPGAAPASSGPPPPPPALGGAAEGSAATGGVRGSFRQAGTQGFNARFGGNTPALWYRRNLEALSGSPTQARAQVAARSGSAGGGDIPAPSSAQTGGTDDDVGGRPGDQDWEQFLRQVQANMFRPGG